MIGSKSNGATGSTEAGASSEIAMAASTGSVIGVGGGVIRWIIERDIEQRMKKMTIEREQIARVCHEVNRAYCQAIGDMSQPTWDDATEWQKQSALLGVNLHCNYDVGPEASHESWMAQKIADGWVFGETKDPEVKTHPCIVPFADLPREQQAKDFIFRAVVHALRND